MNSIIKNEKSYCRLKGEIFAKLVEGEVSDARKMCLDSPDFNESNIIVDVASDLIAEWAFTGSISLVNEHVPGILVLAVGTGAVGWDLQNPPAETASQTLLENELTRKTFSSKTYVDISGNPTVTRTNIIDFTTTYLEAEAVGPLVEMGLFGGTGATSTNGGSMVNYKTMAVLNKPSTSKLVVVWRLTF